MLEKPVLCPAPCCVQARGGECPLGPDVPQPGSEPMLQKLAPVPAPRRRQEQDGGHDPAPTLSNLGHRRRQEKRRRRREGLRKQEKDGLMVDLDSSSEEETCQEMNRLTLDEETEPWVYYEDNFFPGDKENLDVESFKDDGFGMIKSDQVCGIIQISGQLHIEHLPCHDHHDDQEDDANIHDYDSKDENFKHEVIKPEIDNNTDTTEFDADRNDAEQADLHEVDDEDHGYRDYDADQADRLDVEDEGVEGGEGYEDHGEEESVEEEELEDEDNPEEDEFDEDDDDADYDDGHDDYDDKDCDYDYDSCNDCEEEDD